MTACHNKLLLKALTINDSVGLLAAMLFAEPTYAKITIYKYSMPETRGFIHSFINSFTR